MNACLPLCLLAKCHACLPIPVFPWFCSLSSYHVAGLAIYNGHILEFSFPMVLYKKLLGEKGPLGLEDLKQVHPEVGCVTDRMLEIIFVLDRLVGVLPPLYYTVMFYVFYYTIMV